MKTVVIAAKPSGEKIRETIDSVCEFLRKKGVNILFDERAAAVVGCEPTSEELIREKSDLAVVLGGDGTLIAASRLLGNSEIPILGVNLGRLGFLTEIGINDAISYLDSFLQGDYKIEKRMKLHCHIEQEGQKKLEIEVLNDVVINKSDLARIIEMEVFINGEFVNHYRADGLIVSTPTGSTAYNLAAGGPIVHPETEVMILSPICPHALSNRPIVINNSSHISVRLRSLNEKVSITFDGQVWREIDPSMTVTVKRAGSHAQLIVPKNKNYYSLLRGKLGWGDNGC